MNERINGLLTKVVNSKHMAGGIILLGIIFSGLGVVSVMYGAYYKGVKNGVDARDEYYYQKEIKDYEQKNRFKEGN